jgi:hypothetical protein
VYQLSQRDKIFILNRTFNTKNIFNRIFKNDWCDYVSPWILDGGSIFESILDIIVYEYLHE